jgi:hypothetical protein
MAKPRRWRKTPYYKIQVYNAVFQSWKDERGAFASIEEARSYIAERIAPATARIMVVERDHRYVLENGEMDLPE